jgi:hypothetical protein
MDPFQRFGYSLMAYCPPKLIRIGLAAAVGLGRLFVSPLAWAAARLAGDDGDEARSSSGGSSSHGHSGGGKGGSGGAASDGVALLVIDSSGSLSHDAAPAHAQYGVTHRHPAPPPASMAAAAASLQVPAAGSGSGRASSGGGLAAPSADGPGLTLKAAAAGGLGLLNDVFAAPKLADGWWQVGCAQCSGPPCLPLRAVVGPSEGLGTQRPASPTALTASMVPTPRYPALPALAPGPLPPYLAATHPTPPHPTSPHPTPPHPTPPHPTPPHPHPTPPHPHPTTNTLQLLGHGAHLLPLDRLYSGRHPAAHLCGPRRVRHLRHPRHGAPPCGAHPRCGSLRSWAPSLRPLPMPGSRLGC